MADSRGPSSRIEIRVLQPRHVASIRDTVSRDDVTQTLGASYQAIKDVLARQGLQPDGSPFARWHAFGEQVDLEAGLMVKAPITQDGKVKPSELPGGPAAIAVHAGPYEGLKATYDALEAWMTRTSRTANGGPWEIYLTDPSSEPDSGKWLTEIIYPLRKS